MFFVFGVTTLMQNRIQAKKLRTSFSGAYGGLHSAELGYRACRSREMRNSQCNALHVTGAGREGDRFHGRWTSRFD
jgi:hypothetical protein